jgi:hypothetical protein
VRPPPLSLVAKALIAAAPPGVPVAALALALAQSIGAEGAWGWQDGGADVWPFEGTNNFGAIHATRGFAQRYEQGGDLTLGGVAVSYSAGWGMVAFLDHAPGAYVARMAVYPSLAAGADAFLKLLARDVDLANTTTAADFAAQLYVHNYFVGFHVNRTAVPNRAAAYRDNTWSDDDYANIGDYAAAIGRHVPAAQAALAAASSEPGDPTEATHGPPFAPLALRLTPSGGMAPHTLDHARALLGQAADRPPAGGIALADALNSPRGDGVWMFPEGVEVPAEPGAATAAPVSRVRAEEFAGAAAAVGIALGLGAAAAVLKWRPDWIPTLGGYA